MYTILNVIENQIEADEISTRFTFLADGETATESLSIEEIRNTSLNIAQILPKNSTVLICLPQGLSFIKAFLGCLYAQAVAVPTSIPTKNRGMDNLKLIIKDAEILYGITDQNILANFRKWTDGDDNITQIKWFMTEDFEKEQSTVADVIKLPNPNQTAFLQYSSGSTGNPKAVVVTHENIIANSRFIQKSFQNNSESVSVCWLPSFHDMGLIDGIIQPIFSGFNAVLMTPTHFMQKPVRWFKALTDYRATYSGAPNFAFDYCSDRIKNEELEAIDLRSLRCLYNGSEPIRSKTISRFVEKFSPKGFSAEKMFSCYGLAEATLAVTMSQLGSKPALLKVDEKSLQSNRILLAENERNVELVGCGYASEETDVRIIDQETFKECREMEVGEIWVAGETVTSGYFNNLQLTAANYVFREDTRYLRTGDLGFLLNKELFVTGRIKDLIIIRGKNHYPQDIEQTVSNCHDALQTNGCAVFSSEIDEVEKLVVVQEVKRSFLRRADYELIFASIMSEVSCKHGVAPHQVVLISPGSLPKTTSGKVRRGVCRQLWLSKKLKTLN